MVESPSQPRVLLISLPLGLQELLAVALGRHSDLVLGSSMADALTHIAKSSPALAIVDFSQELDAITVFRSLRRAAPDCAVALLVSRKEEADSLKQLTGLSADALFNRPVILSEVLRGIEALLALHGGTNINLPRLSPFGSR